MRYLYILFFIICITVKAAIAKPCFFTDTNKTIIDTDTVIRKQSVSVGISYGSDALFFGRTGPIKYPYITTDLIYNTKPGFFVYASGLKVLGYAPEVAEIDLGGGYFYRFSKKFSGTASYTRFIFNKYAQVIKSASSNDINIKNSFDWKILRSGLIVDYLFGESDDIFITISNSKHFESEWSVFDDKDYITFDPGFNVILGTQNFVQKYANEHSYRLFLNDVYSDNSKLAGKNSHFNALNYSFKLPIAYNRPHYTLEASYKYSIPVNVEGQLKNHKESFYNLTFYYLFY